MRNASALRLTQLPGQPGLQASACTRHHMACGKNHTCHGNQGKHQCLNEVGAHEPTTRAIWYVSRDAT